MAFIKWPSLINHYQQKEIDYWLDMHSGLEDECYVVTEKLHGANFQWDIGGSDIQCGSRNQYLDIQGSFQGASIPKLYADNECLLQWLVHYSYSTCTNIRLFGELIGPGIQKGVKYTTTKELRYFGIMFDDILSPFHTLEGMLTCANCAHLLVPRVALKYGIEEALAIDTEFNSLMLPGETDNICEGVVIQPYMDVYRSPQGSTFIVKKKNERFAERAKAERPPRERNVLNEEFRTYICDNRVQSVFSKHGEIERLDQVGEYIRLVLEDAKVDFNTDFADEIIGLNTKELRVIYNVGADIARLLKEYL